MCPVHNSRDWLNRVDAFFIIAWSSLGDEVKQNFGGGGGEHWHPGPPPISSPALSLSAKPGKQMSLEFPRIISLQIQDTSKDFES